MIKSPPLNNFDEYIEWLKDYYPNHYKDRAPNKYPSICVMDGDDPFYMDFVYLT